MKTLTDHLSQYAAYHQDSRNVATHFVGIPMIVVAVATLLSRPLWMVGDVPLTLAAIVSLLSCLFYLRLDIRFGITMTLLMVLSVAAGYWFAAQGTAVWLSAGGGFEKGALAFNHFQVYFTARMYWGGKEADVDAMFREYCRLFYGPAEQEMLNFFTFCEFARGEIGIG